MKFHRHVTRLARAIGFLIVMAVLTPVIVFSILWALILRIFRIGPNMRQVPVRSDQPAK
jgi:hypothetical protein